MKQFFLISLIALLLTACATNRAPVINRSPASSATSSSSGDWRPNSYTVKKGDTLYSIGLEYGYDYREIAAANNIYEPYIIQIGQQLNFSSLNTRASDGATSYESESGVIVSPIETEDVVTASKAPSEAETKPTAPASPPVLSSPKAIREPYTEAAYQRTKPKAPTVAEKPTTKPVETAPKETVKAPSKPAVVEGVTWSWPTQGKVSANFNAASNKGIDITGKNGQAITASSGGKVIYTGSDLRGYGKLVIIKHNKTFLSVYAHNSKINVKEGQIVKSGQKIAEMGNTDTDKTKLHFEIRKKGKSVDPKKFLPQN